MKCRLGEREAEGTHNIQGHRLTRNLLFGCHILSAYYLHHVCAAVIFYAGNSTKLEIRPAQSTGRLHNGTTYNVTQQQNVRHVMPTSQALFFSYRPN